MVLRMTSVDILILGAGWTSQFLIPQLKDASLTFAATTTTGRDDTIPFSFNPDSSDVEPYRKLPAAKTVLITFPLKGAGQSKLLTSLYRKVHGEDNNWIQLGSTGIWNTEDWNDETSDYDTENLRAVAEDELMASVDGCVLNLAGLYGAARQPKNWLSRVIKSKEQLKAKGALHLIHGEDVAQAIIAVHGKFTKRKRWIISDMRTYDWWALTLDWAATTSYVTEDGVQLDYQKLVRDLMVEEGVRALPRDTDKLGRKVDSRKFWNEFEITPRQSITK